LNIVDDLSAAMDGDMGSWLVLLDFSKAFDSLSHDLWCRRLLSFFGFSEKSVKIFFPIFSIMYA
jgi:hypothetical protein